MISIIELQSVTLTKGLHVEFDTVIGRKVKPIDLVKEQHPDALPFFTSDDCSKLDYTGLAIWLCGRLPWLIKLYAPNDPALNVRSCTMIE